MCPPGETVLGPKMGSRAPQNWIHFWTHFLSNFGVAFGGFWVPSGPQDWPGRGLEDPKRAKWSSESPEDDFQKSGFRIGLSPFFALETPKTAPRGPEDCQRASRGSSEAKEKSPPARELKKKLILGPFLADFRAHFGVQTSRKSAPKRGPKMITKKCKYRVPNRDPYYSLRSLQKEHLQPCF